MLDGNFLTEQAIHLGRNAQQQAKAHTQTGRHGFICTIQSSFVIIVLMLHYYVMNCIIFIYILAIF